MTPPSDSYGALVRRALERVEEGMTVGLGSGTTAAAFIRALAKQVHRGFRVQGVSTSRASETLAADCGIPLVDFDEIDLIDITIDGADEVDPQLDLIKGKGGAMVREKIVAAASRRLVIMVDQRKMVERLGTHGTLPVEVVPFGLTPCCRWLADAGLSPQPRYERETLVVTDNGNYIIDCRTGPLDSPAALERMLNDTPGVVGTGLFLQMADAVLVARGDEVETLTRASSA